MAEVLESRTLLTAVNVLGYHNDAASTGQNLSETALTPANVNSASFGKFYSTPVDGQVYAQPLYVAGQNITSGAHQGVHNVTYVVTEHDSLYAIDADTGVVLWQDSFLIPSAAPPPAGTPSPSPPLPAPTSTPTTSTPKSASPARPPSIPITASCI